MSATTIQTYQLSQFQNRNADPFFEITTLKLESSCAVLEPEVSDQYQIYFIKEGSGEYEIDFNQFKIEGAGIFCTSPGQIFNVKSEKVKLAYRLSFNREFYCVETHGKEIACNGLLFNNVHRATVVELSEGQVSGFDLLIDQMIAEIQQKGSAHVEMLESYLRMFLIQTLRLVDQQEKEVQATSHQDDPLVQDFIALVEKHFKELHKVSEYASKLFVSPKSLAKRLNALKYPTPTEVIRNRILLEAKRRLRYTQKHIKEIAYDLGFEDPAYFSRLFSKTVGVSPVEYRGGK